MPTLDFCRLVNKIELISGCVPEFVSSKRSNFHIDMLEFEEDEINFCIAEESKGEEEGTQLKVVMRLKKEYLGISKIE